MTLDSILGSESFTPVNKVLARKLGFEVAGYFCELLRQRIRFGEEKFFFTIESMEEEIGLGRKTQIRAKKILIENNLIKISRKGNPSKEFFSIDDSEVINFISGTASHTETSRPKTVRLYNKNDNIDTNNITIDNSINGITIVDESVIHQENNDDDLEKEKDRKRVQSELINKLISLVKDSVEKEGFIYSKDLERRFAYLLIRNPQLRSLIESTGLGLGGLVGKILKFANEDEFWRGRICSIKTLYYKFPILLNQMILQKKFDTTKNMSKIAIEEREEKAKRFFNI